MTVVSLSDSTSQSFFLLSGAFGKTSLIIFATLLILIGRNASYKFKNIVTTIFGFKDTESLLSFGLLWIIATAMMAIGDTVSLSSSVTSTIQVSSGYYFLLILLLVGLVFTFINMLQQAKLLRKNTIVNIVDDDDRRPIRQEQLGGLFGGLSSMDDEEEEPSDDQRGEGTEVL